MKCYLGDAVYVDVDSATGNLVLTTEDGLRETNRIVLQPQVFHSLVEYVSFLHVPFPRSDDAS